MGSETSRTLDFLLTGSGYNRRIRPQFGGEPIEVFQGPEHANNVVKNVKYEWLRNINKYYFKSDGTIYIYTTNTNFSLFYKCDNRKVAFLTNS